MDEDQSRFSVKASELVWTQCVYCKHLGPGGLCPAFPEGIPDEINYNLHDHHQPFPGDHGIHFEPIEGFENVEIKPLIPRPNSNQESLS
jgi:hypothetical protein